MDLSTRASAHVIGPVDDETVAAESTAPEEKKQKAEPALVVEAAPAPTASESEKTSHKVLIVEDTTELAEVIAATLERIHIQSVHETHVERALEVYETYHPDVILLDIGLPDKTGWKLLDAIKERKDPSPPAVVVITAHGDPANRLMGKLQGVHSYLIKPFTPDEVESVVGAALNKPPETGVSTDSDTSKAEKESLEQAPLPEFVQELLDSVTLEDDAASSTKTAENTTASEPEKADKDTKPAESDIPETDVPLE